MKKNFLQHYALFYIILFCLQACSSSKPQQQFTNLFRKAEAESYSRLMQTDIEQYYTRLQHPLVTRYVDSLGQNIISHNPQMPPLSYQFHVLRTKELNAFSTPNGTIYITLGFLSLFDLEGQFAAALAHELAHHEASHPADTWRRKIFKLAELPKFERSESEEVFKKNYFSKDSYLYYGDNYEFEADEIAISLLYNSGFDPRGYLSYLEETQKQSLTNPDLTKNLIAVHPPLEERIQAVKKYLRQLPPQKDSRLNSATFKEIKSRLQLVKEAELKEKKRTQKSKKGKNG